MSTPREGRLRPPAAGSARDPEPAAGSARDPEPAAGSPRDPEPAAGTARDPEPAAELRRLRLEKAQLTRALLSRPVIDQALGMVMALAPCTGEQAWSALVDLSQHSNVKLRDVAAALVATTEGVALPDPLREQLRRVLRELREPDPR
ncbi:ANTAR domain-containing protein [Streptomyces sp. NPDC007084]|uniref:ANTAR domain-containing protein n=1 Tax=Streptomyces sp. NPDC007084 TaxID=3154313 RepID=UPI0034511F80